MATFVDDRIVRIYQEKIGAVIDDLGRNVEIYLNPDETDCLWCIFDPVSKKSSGQPSPGYDWTIHGDYEGMARCPHCKGEGVIETAVTEVVKCTIRHLDKPDFEEGIVGVFKPGTVRLKCRLADVISGNDLTVSTYFDQAVEVIVDGEHYKVVHVKKGGLRDLFTCVTRLERKN